VALTDLASGSWGARGLYRGWCERAGFIRSCCPVRRARAGRAIGAALTARKLKVRQRELTMISHDNQSMVRTYGVRVVRRVPHPGWGFTQGLLSEGGTVWESVGNYRQSELRRYALADGKSGDQSSTPGDPGGTLDGRVKLAPEFFAEGICRVGDSIWQLTWRS
jgi:glutamine cyclotransferase